MKKNYILAFVLSFAVLMSWQFYVGKTHKPLSVPTEDSASTPGGPVTTPSVPSGNTPVVSLRREKIIVFEIGNNRVSIDPAGGAVAQWEIKDRGEWLPLAPEKEFSIRPLSTFPEVVYGVRQESHRLVLTGRRADGLSIEKILDVSPSSHLHRVTVKLKNLDKASLTASYALGWGPGVEAGDESGKEGREAKGFQRALIFEAGKLTKLKPGTFSGAYDWWGVDGHYFLSAFVHPNGETVTPVTIQVDKEDHYFAVRRIVSVPLNPGESREDTAAFYLGPKGYENLKSLGFGLERSVDFGYFAPFGRVIHGALFLFHKGTRNYGWAIVLLTVIIQILVLPLTVKSFQHGQKMKTIQPQMKRLQELYKNDSRRLNTEMLALYQRHGLRFMGMEGCVPMLIQLPVFWALFSTLRNTFELRHAPWMGWITDLSAHDPFYVLPVLMGVGMFIQQKMTMSSMDPSQKQIMYMMPVIFTFIFLKMPSGLVIYWTTNSLVTIAVQSFLMRRSSSVQVVK